MAVHYDDSTIWDYTSQDITAILLTYLPYVMLLLITAMFFLKYKEKIFETLHKIHKYKNNENICNVSPNLKSSEQSQQELIERLLETMKNEDLRLMEIQDMIGKTNDKLQSFSLRLDNFQDLKDTCSRQYGEITSTFNDFSNDIMGKLDQVSSMHKQHEPVRDVEIEDSAQDPITKDAVQNAIKVDSEITGPGENTLKRNSNYRSKIPVFRKN